MPVKTIIATITCDGCQKDFAVELDRAAKCRPKSTVDDVAWDGVRAGNGGAGMTSVQGEHLLCARCTSYVDAHISDKRAPTYEMVSEALNQREGV